MAYEVICISSDDGADAFSTATEVAEKLGWRLVDEDIVSRAAVEAGVERDVVADVERRKSLVERLLDNLSTSGASMAYVPSLAESLSGPRDDVLRGLIRSIIEEVAAQGNAVIVAHAASLALGERERVLRVMITASPATRARRIAATLNVDEKEATHKLERSEANRADYIKRFYGIAEESPVHYDLVINTDRLSAEQAAALVSACGWGDGALRLRDAALRGASNAWGHRPLLSVQSCGFRASVELWGHYTGQIALETEPGIAFSHSSPMRFRSRSSRRSSSSSRTTSWWVTWAARRRARPCGVRPTSRLRPSAGLALRSTRPIFVSRSTDLETPLGLRLRRSPSSPIVSVPAGAPTSVIITPYASTPKP